MLSQHGCDIVKALYLRQPERGVPAPRARRRVYIRSRTQQRSYCSGLVFVDRMHQRGPVIDTSALVDVGAGPDQLRDSCGVSGTRGKAKRRDRDSRIAS